MSLADLRRTLLHVPDVELPTQHEGIRAALDYLASDAASESIAADCYWPKWHGPWWQMLLLFELGEAQRIPARAVEAMVRALNALPMHTFPLRPEDWPEGLHPARHGSCHCALGSMDQVLAACGVDVDAELPWIVRWFERYQMSDGGLNCDEQAYLVEHECPSSMVGTIACFEAMLRRGPSAFLERAARFLIGRQLVRGSDTQHNADERAAAQAWLAPAFPRFYFYDVLRGVTALVRWASMQRREVPYGVLAPLVRHLAALSPDGILRVARRAHAGKGTWARAADGAWGRVPEAGSFPLLEQVSQIGRESPTLTAQWRTTRHAIVALIDAGLVTDAPLPPT